MFGTIFKKELLDQILSPKFLIVSLLCLVLIPASFLLNFSSYGDAYREYDSSRREAKETTTVYRQPSPLSTFGIGLESVLPKSVVFSKYQSEAKGARAQSEVLSNINGKIDFVVIVGSLLGLFAVLYAGTMACGEKEAGTLKLVLANAVKRSTIIAAKFLGGFTVLLLPFAAAVLIGLLLLLLQGFPLFAAGQAGRVLALLTLAVLYLAALFSLGLLISTRTHKTSLALLASFFVWIFLTFIIPKTSEPIAGLVHKVQSEEAMKANRAQVRGQIEMEKGRALKPLMDKYLSSQSAGGGWKAYTQARGPVAQKYEERLEQTLQKFDAEHELKKSARRRLSLNIARLSPTAVFTQAALNLCDTGVADLDNFDRSLRAHRLQLLQVVFRFQFSDEYSSEDGRTNMGYSGSSRDDDKVDYPQFRYAFPRLEETLRATAPDILLLVFFNLLFFAAAYVSFTRYDVR
jgi:ABC-type transport system involved in multi-copper enzyme maturation permease subunit